MRKIDHDRKALASSALDTCVTVSPATQRWGPNLSSRGIKPDGDAKTNQGVHCANSSSVATGAVFLIGGRNTAPYRRLSEWINPLRMSSTVVSGSNQATTDQGRGFLGKIKLNSITLNLRPIHNNLSQDDDDDNHSDSRDDYVSDCTVVFDWASRPPMLVIAQRAGEDRQLNGNTVLTSPIAIYNVDLALCRVSVITYPPLYKSPHSSVLVEMIRRNITDRLSIIHRPFDLLDEVRHWHLLSKAKEPDTDEDSDE